MLKIIIDQLIQYIKNDKLSAEDELLLHALKSSTNQKKEVKTEVITDNMGNQITLPTSSTAKNQKNKSQNQGQNVAAKMSVLMKKPSFKNNRGSKSRGKSAK